METQIRSNTQGLIIQDFLLPWTPGVVAKLGFDPATLTGILVATLIPVALSLLVSRTLTKPLSSRPSSELEVDSEEEEDDDDEEGSEKSSIL